MICIQNSNFFFIKIVHIAGMLQKSRHIRSNKIFTVTKSYNKRTFFSCTDNSVRIILAEYSKSIRTF